MLLLESSTNTGSEVFTEPCGLNKLLWKEEDDEKRRGGGEKWNGVSVSCSWERARVGSAAPFSFFTLIKSRDAQQWKKHDEKQSLHELKAEGEVAGWGVRGGGRVDTNKQTTTDEQLRRALHWQRGRGRKRRNDGRERERTPVTKMESPHFSAVWKYGPHFMIQFPLPPFPSLSNYPFPYQTLLLSFAAAVRL